MNRFNSAIEQDWRSRARANNRGRLAAAMPLLVMAVYLYGLRPLVLGAVAVVTAVLCDLLASAMRRRPWDRGDVSSILFAVLLVCLMPASVPYHVIIVSVASAILVGKHLFGGAESYPFHPSALGYLFAVISWPAEVLTFPVPLTALELGNTVVFPTTEAPALTLKLGGLPNLSDINVMLGNFGGPLGASATLVVLACGLMLLAVRRFDLATPLSFAAGCVGVVCLFPRIAGVERADLLFMELMVSALAFGAVFLLQDEITSPYGLPARVIYGLVVGVTAMGYQYYGSYPFGICFGVLCGNALSGVFEHIGEILRRKPSGRSKTTGKGGESAV